MRIVEQSPPSVAFVRRGHPADPPWAKLSPYLVPLLIVLLAFALRVYRLPEVPFGWHPDEASKGLLARDVLAGKYAPAFFTAFTGRDALYVYLEALSFALIGEGAFAARVLSAFIGVLTVAGAIALGRVMFTRRTGLLAGILLATSLWHIIASRNGYRAIIQPLVQIPVLWILFRTWRETAEQGRSWPKAILAGVFLGLTQYTYTAARAFPILVLALLLLGWILAPPLVRARGRWLLAVFGAFAVVLLPLAVYFIRNPFDLYGRAIQVSVAAPEWAGGDALGRLWRSIVETARMFSMWGDPNFRFNIAGRPVFGPLMAVGFYGGVALCLWNTLRLRGRGRLVHASLIAWVLVMLLPMTLSAESLPYFQRAIGILPAVYLLPAVALDAVPAVAASLGRRRRTCPLSVQRVARISCYGLGGILVAALTWSAGHAYFGQWHEATRNDDDRRVAMVYAAQSLRGEPAGAALYVSSEYPEHPTLAFLAPDQYQRTKWFDARQSLPLPPPGETATYVLLLENAPEPALLERVPDLLVLRTELDRFDRPVLRVYRWTDGAAPVPDDRSPAIVSSEVAYEPGDPNGLRHPIALPARFGDILTLTGHDRTSASAKRGETLGIILHWRLLQKPDRHYSMFAHLLDDRSDVVAEYDANRFPTSFWREGGGETLLSFFPLWIDPGLPPGEYRLEVGVYHQPTGERLAVYDGGEPVADRLLLRPVIVE